MSRRDTIIVAVLINTGLLAALFMMAIHTEAPLADPNISTAIAEVVTPESPATPLEEEIKTTVEEEKSQAYLASRDEIDEVLKTYSKTNQQPVIISADSSADKNSGTKNASAKNESPKPAVSAKPQEAGFVEVKVKKGDFLEKIAKANGVSVSEIMHANQMVNTRIDVGQVLKIPVEKKETVSKSVAAPKPARQIASAEPEYYTIKSGDNPWKIARQFHVKFEDLLKLNDLDEGKARNLKPGDILRVK